MHFHNSSINEIYIYSKKIPFCLPFRKTDDTSSFSLSRACSRRLRLRPWCIESVASSTFNHLGFNEHNLISLLTGMFFIKNNFLNVKKRLFFLDPILLQSKRCKADPSKSCFVLYRNEWESKSFFDRLFGTMLISICVILNFKTVFLYTWGVGEFLEMSSCP